MRDWLQTHGLSSTGNYEDLEHRFVEAKGYIFLTQDDITQLELKERNDDVDEVDFDLWECNCVGRLRLHTSREEFCGNCQLTSPLTLFTCFCGKKNGRDEPECGTCHAKNPAPRKQIIPAGVDQNLVHQQEVDLKAHTQSSKKEEKQQKKANMQPLMQQQDISHRPWISFGGKKLSHRDRDLIVNIDMLEDQIVEMSMAVMRVQFAHRCDLDESALQATTCFQKDSVSPGGKSVQIHHMPSPLHWVLSSNVRNTRSTSLNEQN